MLENIKTKCFRVSDCQKLEGNMLEFWHLLTQLVLLYWEKLPPTSSWERGEVKQYHRKT